MAYNTNHVFITKYKYKTEISEKHFSTLETRTRISRIQSRTSRRERESLSPNLMLRDKPENNFLQSQASRRDRDLFFSISDYEMRSRIFLSNSQFLRRERESIYCYLSQRNHILSNFFTQKFGEFFTGPRCRCRCRCYTTCTLLFHLEAFQSIARQCCGFSPVLSPESHKLKI